jgi:ankyrin repeat protein
MDRAEQLLEATKAGDYSRVAVSLAEDPRLAGVRGRLGWTPLHHAAERGHSSVIALLIARGADVDAREGGDGATPLHWAACRGHLRAAQILVSAGADVNAADDRYGRGPLGWATLLAEPSEKVARLLLSQGARLDIFSAIALKNVEAVREMIRLSAERAGRSEFLISLRRGRAIRAMVQGDPTTLNATLGPCFDLQRPLHVAVRGGSLEIVRFLVENGADLRARTASGRTPLCMALEMKRRDLVELLIARGAEIDPLAAQALEALESRSLPAETAESAVRGFGRRALAPSSGERSRIALETGV